MLRITLATLCVLFLALLAGLTVGGKAGHQSARSTPIRASQRFLPAHPVAICRPGEKMCRMASYITWCCRADQQCDTRTVGGCR